MKTLLLLCLLSSSISLLAQEDQRSILADLYEGEYTQKGFGDGRVSSKDIKVIRENDEVVGLQFNKTRYELEDAAFPRYLKATTSFKLTVVDGYLIFWNRYGYGGSGEIYVKFVAHKRKVKGSSSKYVEMIEAYLSDTDQAYASAEKRPEREPIRDTRQAHADAVKELKESQRSDRRQAHADAVKELKESQRSTSRQTHANAAKELKEQQATAAVASKGSLKFSGIKEQPIYYEVDNGEEAFSSRVVLFPTHRLLDDGSLLSIFGEAKGYKETNGKQKYIVETKFCKYDRDLNLVSEDSYERKEYSDFNSAQSGYNRNHPKLVYTTANYVFYVLKGIIEIRDKNLDKIAHISIKDIIDNHLDGKNFWLRGVMESKDKKLYLVIATKNTEDSKVMGIARLDISSTGQLSFSHKKLKIFDENLATEVNGYEYRTGSHQLLQVTENEFYLYYAHKKTFDKKSGDNKNGKTYRAIQHLNMDDIDDASKKNMETDDGYKTLTTNQAIYGLTSDATGRLSGVVWSSSKWNVFSYHPDIENSYKKRVLPYEGYVDIEAVDVYKDEIGVLVRDTETETNGSNLKQSYSITLYIFDRNSLSLKASYSAPFPDPDANSLKLDDRQMTQLQLKHRQIKYIFDDSYGFLLQYKKGKKISKFSFTY